MKIKKVNEMSEFPMNKTFTYTPDLTGLNVIKTEDEQNDKFFYSGHPYFLIPDFDTEKADIWLSFLDFLDREIGETWDQNGGEIEEHEIIAPDGLTKCTYVAYEIQATEDSELENWNVDITGYVVEDGEEVYFLATEVKIIH